ncbi:phosphatase PAP2 family protein [Endozoicomonas elysicola]|uniref:phosphatase PAP2 family protein n=1 Tax=Endozoicomonas elysicola TaxID=305900 RepID=UPI0003662E6B|nr:phosphatase PAP2 family protein [Endozoicomonas elysicola]
MGLTYYHEDADGRWQFVKSFAASQLMVHGAKLMIEKRRPNYDEFSSSNNPPNSFPSGHTSAAFGGASFIYSRYGAQWGLPAYAMAAFTGYSWVYAEKHYWDDVIAGASIATLSSLYFVNSVNDDIAFLPCSDGLGVNIVMSSAVFDSRSSQEKKRYNTDFEGKYYFEFYPSISHFTSNDFAGGGTGIDYKHAENEIMTSAVRWSYQADSLNHLSFFWHPYEIRALGEVSGEQYHSRFMANDFRVSWLHHLPLTYRFPGKMGVSLVAQYTEAEIYKSPTSRSTQADKSEWFFYPMISGSLEYQFGNGIGLTASGSWGKNSKGKIRDASMEVNYRFDPRWDVGAGYNWYERDQPDSSSFRHIEFDNYYVKAGYRF